MQVHVAVAPLLYNAAEDDSASAGLADSWIFVISI